MGIPQNSEEVKNDMNIMTKYGIDDDDKVVRRYKFEKKQVAKTIAENKAWTKFLVQASKEEDDGNDILGAVHLPLTTLATWSCCFLLFCLYIAKIIEFT